MLFQIRKKGHTFSNLHMVPLFRIQNRNFLFWKRPFILCHSSFEKITLNILNNNAPPRLKSRCLAVTFAKYHRTENKISEQHFSAFYIFIYYILIIYLLFFSIFEKDSRQEAKNHYNIQKKLKTKKIFCMSFLQWGIKISEFLEKIRKKETATKTTFATMKKFHLMTLRRLNFSKCCFISGTH